jgi:hypothetical protein
MLVYVGKQGRLRAERAAMEAADRRDHIARVQVSDQVWAAFRAGLRTTPGNVALGELVTREVGRLGALPTTHTASEPRSRMRAQSPTS